MTTTQQHALRWFCMFVCFFPRATLPYVFKLNKQAIYWSSIGPRITATPKTRTLKAATFTPSVTRSWLLQDLTGGGQPTVKPVTLVLLPPQLSPLLLLLLLGSRGVQPPSASVPPASSSCCCCCPPRHHLFASSSMPSRRTHRLRSARRQFVLSVL